MRGLLHTGSHKNRTTDQQMMFRACLSECVANFSTRIKPTKSTSNDVLDQTTTRKKFNPFRPRYQVPVQESILFGIHPVQEALERNSRTLHRLFVKKGTKVDDGKVTEICKKAAEMGLPVQEVATDVLCLLAHGRPHQGVCLDAGALPVHSLKDDEELPVQGPPPLWLLLMVKKNSCKLSAIVSKASSGAMETMDIYMVTNLLHFLEKMKSRQWTILGSANEGGGAHRKPLDAGQYAVLTPTMLIVGNEGSGISDEILPYCNDIITVPAGKNIITRVDSLNVSVATGILLNNLLASRPACWNSSSR